MHPKKGFQLYNFSIGSVVYSSTEEAIKNYPGLFVAAAGNNGIDMTDKPFYPASLDIPNIITVGNSSGYERSLIQIIVKQVLIYSLEGFVFLVHF